MAFSNLEKLNDAALEKVAGGLAVTNRFGDGSIYKVGFTQDNYLYTIKASDMGTFGEEAQKIQNAHPGATPAEKDQLLMQALLNIPGLLTPIA